MLETLVDTPLVLVEGLPRCGKTTLAAQIARAASGGAFLVDGSVPGAANLLLEPELALAELGRAGSGGAQLSGRLLVVDRADWDPAYLPALASFAAREAARAESRPSVSRGIRMALLGTTFPACQEFPDAPRFSLGPLSLAEVGREARTAHWLRGGFPEAFFAPSDQAAFAWLGRWLDSAAEARLAEAGLPWAPGRTRRILAMLAEAHGGPFNENAAASALGVSRPTVVRFVAALERAGVLRSLPAAASASGGRARRSASVCFRDSGLLHALLGISSAESLLRNSRLVASWQGYVIEQALAALPEDVSSGTYSSKDGAALELVFTRRGAVIAGAAIRWSSAIHAPPRGASSASSSLKCPRSWLVVPDAAELDLGGAFTLVGLSRFLELLADL